MNIEALKQKITAANAAYRNGSPTMADLEYDELLEAFQKAVSQDEYDEFRDTLFDGAGDVKHPYVMGSLNKVKIEEPAAIKKFIKKHVKTLLNVSAKVDGISCRLHYENGKLVSATTRGDGMKGKDLTPKIWFVNHVPAEISCKDKLDIRGELVILKKDFAKMDGFANARNACAGIMNRKDFKQSDVHNVSFVAYTVLGPKYGKATQFSFLNVNGFKKAWNANYTKSEYEDPGFIDVLMDKAMASYDYEVDGLVIADAEYKNENKYRPDACVAVKTNQLIAETTLIDVSFDGPSKNGFFIPVAELEPVELGGSTISRATLHNLDFIAEKGLKYGSRIKIVKSGDIIPKVIAVIENPAGCTDIELPDECPCCGTKLVREGVNVRCMNKDCSAQKLKQVTAFIKQLGVKNASEATLKKLRIDDVKSLLAFRPNKKHKSETKLYDEVLSKVLSRSKTELLAAMNFKDLGETLINKIVEFYGYDSIAAGKQYVGLPDGVGELTLQKFKDCILENLAQVNMIINDSRYSFLESSQNALATTKSNMNGMSVCFTGKLNSMSRSQASKLAEENGYEVRGAVNKGLTYLVTNDPNSGSSKNRKAKELGTHVISEEQFLKLCKNVENDIMDL